MPLITFTYLTPLSPKVKEGVLWNNGCLGTEDGDRYRTVEDFLKSGATFNSFDGWYAKAVADMFADLLRLTAPGESEDDCPRLRRVEGRYETHYYFDVDTYNGIKFSLEEGDLYVEDCHERQVSPPREDFPLVVVNTCKAAVQAAKEASRKEAEASYR